MANKPSKNHPWRQYKIFDRTDKSIVDFRSFKKVRVNHFGRRVYILEHKEAHPWWLDNKIYEEDRYTEKDLHPDHPDNK